MDQVEIPIEDIREISSLGENPVYRFEELLNETNRNELESVLFDQLELDISADDIDDYEIMADKVVLYIDDVDDEA